MVGLFDKVKNVFGKKEEVVREEDVVRISKPEERVREEDEPGKMYLKAKKWREQKAMEEPLVKRNDYKRKY